MSTASAKKSKALGAGHALLAIVGPTAVGKTALGLALARRFAVEVVGVDSRQVYRGMDIGTAKPTPAERAQVPHHLVDIADPGDGFSLATYLDKARKAISDIHNQGLTPLLIGGTGQYLWALLDDWRIPSVPPDQDYRRHLQEIAHTQGAEALHARLARVDPRAATSIDLRNQRRVIRALEVHHQTGVPFSELRRRGPEPYRALILGLTLSREALYRRINERVESMIEAGWIEEVRRLLEQGLTADFPSMSSVGYRDIAAYLGGDLALEQANQNIKTSTHRFARHQYSWFRLSDPRIHWLQVDTDALEEQSTSLISGFLASNV